MTPAYKFYISYSKRCCSSCTRNNTICWLIQNNITFTISKSFRRILQNLIRFFNGTLNSTPSISRSFPVISALSLKYSESVMWSPSFSAVHICDTAIAFIFSWVITSILCWIMHRHQNFNMFLTIRLHIIYFTFPIWRWCIILKYYIFISFACLPCCHIYNTALSC